MSNRSQSPASRSDIRTPFEVKARLEPYSSHELIVELRRREDMPQLSCECCDDADTLGGGDLYTVRALIMAGDIEEAMIQLGRADEALADLPYAFERFMRARKG